MPREWVINAYDGFEGLELVSCEIAEPGPTDVRLRVEAFALNWGDADLMRDMYSFSFSSFPARVGIEAAGIVEAVGSEVTGIAVGDRYGTLPYFYDRRGASADTMLIDARYLAPSPPSLSGVESASIWMQYMTAYYPVIEMAKAAPGVNVLVPAGTSTAGNAAIEIARLRGATSIATTRHERNREYLENSGATHVFVDDGATDLAEFILDATNGVGVHLAFDPVGGDFPARYAPAMAKNGILALYGLLAGSFPTFPVVPMFQSSGWLHAYSVFNYVQDADACARGIAFVHDSIAAGVLQPTIDRVYPMEGYVDAWHYLRGERTTFGKVVVETGA
ncbi:MAG: zinc-dependent alcohol dehydrogenase family protein [Actinomycetota bacterium]